MDFKDSVPEPTPEEEVAQALMQWLTDNPNPNAGTVCLRDDRKTVVIYWKGDPPADLQRLATSQPIPVAIRQATYSKVELVTVARWLIGNHRGVISSAGPSNDFSGVGITLSSKAPQTALAAVIAQSPVPIEFRGVMDIRSGPGRPSSPPAESSS
jgi:hypothetical protein